MPNSTDRIKFDFSTAVARRLKPSRATAVHNMEMFTRHLFFKFFLFVLMTLIASIVTFSKKKLKKKKCYPRHGTLDPRRGIKLEPSTLDKKIDSPFFSLPPRVAFSRVG